MYFGYFTIFYKFYRLYRWNKLVKKIEWWIKSWRQFHKKYCCENATAKFFKCKSFPQLHVKGRARAGKTKSVWFTFWGWNFSVQISTYHDLDFITTLRFITMVTVIVFKVSMGNRSFSENMMVSGLLVLETYLACFSLLAHWRDPRISPLWTGLSAPQTDIVRIQSMHCILPLSIIWMCRLCQLANEVSIHL